MECGLAMAFFLLRAFAASREIMSWAGDMVLRAKSVAAPKYDLDQMLALMTPDTFPDDLDFGPPQGREAW
jgi:antitoxin component of MazEF toxin-antitoxin module